MVYYVLVSFSGCDGLLGFSVVLGLCWFTMFWCRSRAVLVCYVLVLFSGCAGLLCFGVVLGLCWFTMF